MDQPTENQETGFAPPFTPQPPPPKIGVLRSILLVLMAAVGAVDVFLLGGVFLSLSAPDTLPIASQTVQTAPPRGIASSSFRSASSSGADNPSIPANAAPVQSQSGTPAQPTSSSMEQQTPINSAAQGDPVEEEVNIPDFNEPILDPPQFEDDQPDGQQPEGGNQPENFPAAAPDQPEEDENTGPSLPDSGAQQAPVQPNNPTTSDTQGHTIYITRTGDHYHYNNRCNGGTYYESTLEEALRRGLTPCNKCVN